MSADCPHCHDTGIVTRPYIAGVVSVMSACDCPAGQTVALMYAENTAILSAALKLRPCKAISRERGDETEGCNK